MFNSRFMTVMLSLTALALIAMVVFQVLEMQHYELFGVLKDRFF